MIEPTPISSSDVLLDELKSRVADSQKLLTDTAQQLQAAQQAHIQAQQQHNIWNGALQTILRERQAKELAAKEKQLPLPGAKPVVVPAIEASATPETHDSTEPVNKTGIIREIIRQHPTGISASEIWKQIGDQLKYRAYLYNVLKRLRDRDELTLRRQKYAIKQNVEVPTQTEMVQ